jgi:hypothetical protein
MFDKTLMTLDSISEMMLNCGGVGCQPVSINLSINARPEERAQLLNEFTKLLEEKAEEVSRTITHPVQKTVKTVRSGVKRAAEVA